MNAVTVPDLLDGMRRGHLQQVGLPTLVAAVVLLVSGVLLLGVNVTRLEESFAWVQEADDELIQIAEVDKRLVGNELTVRGYALTDDPVFLTYHANEQRLMNAAIDKLGKQLADDPAEMRLHFAETRVLVRKRLDFFTHLVGLGPGHAQVVAVAIRDPGNRAVMRAARASVDVLRNLELKELSDRQAVTAGQAKRTYALAIGIVILAFVFGAAGIAFALIGRDRQPVRQSARFVNKS